MKLVGTLSSLAVAILNAFDSTFEVTTKVIKQASWQAAAAE